MKSTLFPAAAFLAASLFALPLGAVDVVNQDEEDRLITVTDENGTEEIVVGPGETLADICETCKIQLEGGQPVDVKADEVVVIKNNSMAKGG